MPLTSKKARCFDHAKLTLRGSNLQYLGQHMIDRDRQAQGHAFHTVDTCVHNQGVANRLA